MKTLSTAVALALQGATQVNSMFNSSGFDPKLLLDASFAEANSIVRIPVPIGEHVALIEKIGMSNGTGKDGKEWARLDVTYNIDSQAVKEQLGRDKVTLSQGIMLDRTPEGGLDFSKGRNVTLGRLREATNLNTPGQPFSFRMLEGKVLKIVVGHSPSDRPGAQPGDVYENVNAFVRA